MNWDYMGVCVALALYELFEYVCRFSVPINFRTCLMSRNIGGFPFICWGDQFQNIDRIRGITT